MKATPGSIFIGALALGVVVTVAYALIGSPAPPPVPAALAAAGSPAQQEGDGSPNSAGAAALPDGRGDSFTPRANSGTPGRSWPVAGSGAEMQPGAPAGLLQQEQELQDRPVGSAAAGSAEEVPGASGVSGTRSGIAGSVPLPPIPASAQVPLAFRPLAPALSTSNPQLANSLQMLQQNFLNALGGQNQNPNDPAYADRWDAAQLQSDDQYRLLVGNENYLIEQESVAGKASR